MRWTELFIISVSYAPFDKRVGRYMIVVKPIRKKLAFCSVWMVVVKKPLNIWQTPQAGLNNFAVPGVAVFLQDL